MSPAERESVINVGILGCGNVGGALVNLIAARSAAITQRTGLQLRVSAVAVRDTSIERPGVPAQILTSDATGVVSDPNIDLVVEVIGGIEPARSLVLEALKHGKPVVTGNKALLANVGTELFEAADAAGVDLLFEAAVAGGIPLMRPLRESLAAEEIVRITGIVNGTTNYILSQMTDSGASYEQSLAEAQQLGFAESDPTADVEGFDASAKAAVLATVAFGRRVVVGDVYREGISAVSDADVAFARRLGFVIKLLAIIEDTPRGISVRVYPAMISERHPLATVRGSYNAVFIEGSAVGQLMFYGRGAGGMPTASAVLGDVVDAAVNLKKGTHATIGTFPAATIAPIDEMTSEFYVNLEVRDEPGVLAAVAGTFGRYGVSIRKVEQDGLGQEARVVLITHEARERDIQSVLEELRSSPVVGRVVSFLRVVGGN